MLLIIAVLTMSQPGTAIAHEGDDDPMPADTSDGLRPIYEVPSGADRIIGSPEAGPEPQQSGDRGGSLQLATMGAVAAAVALIAWRISHSARRSRHHRVAQPSG